MGLCALDISSHLFCEFPSFLFGPHSLSYLFLPFGLLQNDDEFLHTHDLVFIRVVIRRLTHAITCFLILTFFLRSFQGMFFIQFHVLSAGSCILFDFADVFIVAMFVEVAQLVGGESFALFLADEGAEFVYVVF